MTDSIPTVLATIYARLPDERVMVYDLYSTPVTIGRGIDAEVALPHMSVATRHALLAQPAKSLAIEDLGSTLGTELNGIRLEKGELYEVLSGATVKLGDVTLSIVGAGEKHPNWIQLAELKSRPTKPTAITAALLVAEGKVLEEALAQTAEQVAVTTPTEIPEPPPEEIPEVEKRQPIQAVGAVGTAPVEDLPPEPVVTNPTADLSTDDFGLDDPDFSELALEIDPSESGDTFNVKVTNTSNQPLLVEVNVADQHGKLSYSCNPNIFELDAGKSDVAALSVKCLERRSKRRRYPFRVLALVDDLPLAETTAVYVRKPLSVGCLAGILGGLALLLLGAFGAGTAALCPTVLDNNCPIEVPVNQLSMMVATPQTPTATLPPPTQLPTAEPITQVPTFTFTPVATATPAVTAEPTIEPTPTPGARLAFFSYKIAEDDIVTLYGSVDGAEAVALVSGVSDAQVLGTTSELGGKYAVRVSQFGEETLWLVDATGTVLASDINVNWDTVLDAQWAPNGLWLTVTASSADDDRFFVIFDGEDGTLLREPDLVAEFPTLTPAPADTPDPDAEADTETETDAETAEDAVDPTEPVTEEDEG